MGILAASGSGLLLTAQQVQDVGSWLASAPVADSRSGAASVTLNDGRTLIAGGRLDADGSVTDAIAIYDPVTNVRQAIGHLHAPRVGATATLLTDGRILIIGGSIDNVPTNEIELIDLAFAPDILGSPFAYLNQARTRHAATRLLDGRVLIVGGNVATFDGTPTTYVATDSAEMYDPASGQVTILPERLNVARAGLSATTIIDGRVLVAGGSNATGDLNSAEMFDPARGFEVLETGLSVPRSGHTAILLPHNNTVLIAGGTSAGEAVTAADAFLPAQFPDPFSYGVGAFAAAEPMPVARTRAVGGPRGDNGFAYVAGGGPGDSAMYRYATVKTDKTDYAPGERALITGSGWEPNSTLTLTFQEDPAVHDDYVLTVPTDANGDFSWDQWAPEQHDLFVRFYLLARQGAPSGERVAQITFTDALSTITLSPNSGATAGGTNVTITSSGNAFNSGSSPYTVLFGSAQVAGTYVDNRHLRVVTPAHSAGAVDVSIVDKNNPAVETLTRGFTYIASKLNQTIAFGSLADKAYGDPDFTVAATATSGLTVSFAASGACSISGSTAHVAGVGACTITASQDGDNNYNAAPGVSQTFNISKAGQTITFNPLAARTFGDPDFTVTATAGSGLPVTFTAAGTCTSTGDSIHIVGAGSCTVTASQAGDTNYDAATPVAQTFAIAKANPTIQVGGYAGVYDGNAHGATGTARGVNNETLGGLDLGASFTNVPGGTATWTFTDATGNYNNATGTASVLITKAEATITVTGHEGVYDGEAHGATGHAKGVKGESLGGLDLGGSFTNVPGGTANWTFTDQTGNYTNTNGTVAIVISKADATVTVNGYSGIYDGNAHGVTGTITGVKGEALTGLNPGASFTNVPGGTATWTFTDATGNYNDDSGTAAIVISKADATIHVEGYTGTYDGNAHGATGSATGVQNERLAGLSLGASFTNVPGGTATWTFTDATGNYNDDAGTAAIVISKANATIHVEGYTGTYDGNAHGATGTAEGINGVGLTGLNLGASFTDAPGGTANWTFTDATGNYNDATGTVSITITKADATVTVTGYTGVYDGNAHGATGTAIGVKGESLAGLNLGASFTNVPGGTANWTFTDATGNYNDDAGTAAIVISKADATIRVEGYTGTYDGNAHGATGTAIGVKGESLAGLNLGASFTNVPGSTANWTFTDATGNYNDANGTVSITITKADATVTVTGYTGVYDGNAHGATGTATGVKGESLTGLNLGASFTDAPGGTANWTFTDATGNYKNANGSVSITIDKAHAVINVAGYSVAYDGAPHTATGTAKGVKGEDLSSLLNLAATTHTNPGTYNDNWSFAGNVNYDTAGGAVADNIGYGVCSATSGPGNVILPPINTDGSSVYNRKGGSTIPVKFRVCDAGGRPISNASLVFAKAGSVLQILSAVRGTVAIINEDGVNDVPDAMFRWTGSEWIFNMATSNLTAGNTYTFSINLLSGQAITFRVGVK